jgi:hypothetical protein
MKIPDGWIFTATPKMASIELKSNELIKCKHCKYYKEDVFATIESLHPGMPIIVGHNLCEKWGNGCVTDPDGFCHMAEPNEEK